MDRASLDKLKVADLKKLLKERGLKTTGTKPELITILLSASESSVTEEQNGNEHELDALEGEDALPSASDVSVDAAADQSHEDSLLQTSLGLPAVAKNDIPSVAKVQPKAASQKIAIASLQEVDDAKKTNANPLAARVQRFGVVSADVKKMTRAERFGLSSKETTATSSADSEKTKKRAERFGVISAPELLKESDADKLKKRADKFGLSTSSSIPPKGTTKLPAVTDEKLKSRAQRFGTAADTTTETKTAGTTNIDALKKRAEKFGAVTSVSLATAEEQEKILKRKERFAGASNSEPEAKKVKRLERFAFTPVTT